jgi:hypothetical protein
LKKKILFIISSDLYIRNYLNTSVLQKISKYHDLNLIVSDDVKNIKKLKNLKFFKGFYFQNKFKEKIFFLFNDLFVWKNKNLSSSFEYRMKRNFINYSKWRKLFLYIFSNNLFIIFFGNVLIKILNNKELNCYINKINPEMIIMPISVLEISTFLLHSICREKKIKSIFLVDNWDNISSKSLFFKKPDLLGVWGEQSKNHAIKIQKFEKKKVFNIGTPRFDMYFNKITNKKNKFNFKYILFCGTAVEFDEEGALLKIDEILYKNKLFFGNCKIIYRPHPWRQSTKFINIKKLKSVIIDTQLKKNYFSKKFDVSFQPNLSHYPSLISNSEFVVGGLTSMIVETLILQKNYLALAFADNNFTNQKDILNNLEHLKIIKKIKNISICSDINSQDLEKKLKFFWTSKIIYKKNLCKYLKKLIYYDNYPYYKRLLKQI